MPQDGRRRAARRREFPEVAPDTRAALPAPKRNARSTQDGGSAVQLSGLSYTAHWEALGCALCLLTTPEISGTGTVRGRGFCPGSHRPRARVPLVVWAWDLLLCGFLAAVSRPLLSHCFSLCDLRLFINKRMLLSFSLCDLRLFVNKRMLLSCDKRENICGLIRSASNLCLCANKALIECVALEAVAQAC